MKIWVIIKQLQAKKIDQGILDVRIELPFPIWCLGCKRKFAMGVRYTAEKFMVGKYLSTPIYKFKMKCHMCPQFRVFFGQLKIVLVSPLGTTELEAV